MNVYLASLLGFIAVIILMGLAIKIAEKYKRKAPDKAPGENRNKRRHGR